MTYRFLLFEFLALANPRLYAFGSVLRIGLLCVSLGPHDSHPPVVFVLLQGEPLQLCESRSTTPPICNYLPILCHFSGWQAHGRHGEVQLFSACTSEILNMSRFGSIPKMGDSSVICVIFQVVFFLIFICPVWPGHRRYLSDHGLSGQGIDDASVIRHLDGLSAHGQFADGKAATRRWRPTRWPIGPNRTGQADLAFYAPWQARAFKFGPRRCLLLQCRWSKLWTACWTSNSSPSMAFGSMSRMRPILRRHLLRGPGFD